MSISVGKVLSESTESVVHSLDDGATANITSEHRDYLLNRHGTVDLNPLPSMDPMDPLNWSSFQKHMLLLFVSIHSMMSTFSAAAIIPAFIPLAEQFGTTVQIASYLTSAPILALGLFPIPWTVLSSRIGRRPIYLISTMGAAIFHFLAAFMASYNLLMAMRILQGIFQATAIAVGASTVTEMFFSYQLGQKMGIWTLLSTLGPPLGPLVFGFVVERKGWTNIFILLAILNTLTFLGFFFFGGETLFNREAARVIRPEQSSAQNKGFVKKYLQFCIINKKAITILDFVRPFFLGTNLNVLIPTFVYSLVFCYTGVALTVLVPQTFGEKFHLTAEGIGLQFIAPVIGTVIGEQIGGPLSDWVVKFRSEKASGRGNKRAVPELRLVASYIGFIAAFAGLMIWGILLERAGSKWIIGPAVGSAVAVFGLQIVTTVCITYSIQCHMEDKGMVSAFIVFFRQLWAFAGPFYFTPMLEHLGIQNTAIIFACLSIIAGLILGLWDLYTTINRRKPLLRTCI